MIFNVVLHGLMILVVNPSSVVVYLPKVEGHHPHVYQWGTADVNTHKAFNAGKEYKLDITGRNPYVGTDEKFPPVCSITTLQKNECNAILDERNGNVSLDDSKSYVRIELPLPDEVVPLVQYYPKGRSGFFYGGQVGKYLVVAKYLPEVYVFRYQLRENPVVKFADKEWIPQDNLHIHSSLKDALQYPAEMLEHHRAIVTATDAMLSNVDVHYKERLERGDPVFWSCPLGISSKDLVPLFEQTANPPPDYCDWPPPASRHPRFSDTSNCDFKIVVIADPYKAQRKALTGK